MIHGVDVSAYQSETYSITGLDFVFVKATEGLSYTNPRMAAQVKRARDAGLVVGFYHYPHMANDPKAEADYFLRKAPVQAGDVIVFDWEGYDAANKGVAKSRQVTYRDAWLKYVRSKLPAHKVGMYCNTDYWLNVDNSSNCGDFLWIATAGKAAGQPGIKAKWTFHQYSTANNIDHDVAAFPDRAALAAWARGTTPPKEDDVALTAADVKTLWLTDGFVKNPNPDTAKTNPFIAPATGLNNIESVVRRTEVKLAALQATNDKLVETVATLAAGLGDLDPAAIVTELKQAIESINIHLDVPDA